jgi:ubiquitin-conjugating enzyme E2 variant
MISALAKRLQLSAGGMKYSTAPTWIASAALCWSLYRVVQSPPSLLQGVLLLVACFFLTDLISGLLHVVLDNPRSLEVKPLYKLAIGFQRHHENPATIFEMSLYNHLYVMHLPLAAFFVVTALLGHELYLLSYVVMFAMLHLMQMAHRWSHQPADDVPRPVAALQRAGVLLDKPHHDEHHTPPYSKNFCIMTGMADPLLNVAVRRLGGTSHWWNAAFLTAALTPAFIAFLLIRFVA